MEYNPVQPPQSNVLPTHLLSQVFNDTTLTYKYYWFISILQIYNETNESKINIFDIVSRMIANAWYPIHYFHLSFGKQDLFQKLYKMKSYEMKFL